MNEAETRAELIDPALKAAGWGVTSESRIRPEVIAVGRLLGSGQRQSLNGLIMCWFTATINSQS